MNATGLGTLGLVILIGYLMAITAVGVWYGKKQARSRTGYFLGGRNFTWWMIGGSLLATNISSTQMTAQSGDAYRLGIAAGNAQMMGGIMMVVAAAYFVPMYLRTGILTVPQFLQLRFSRGCKVFFSLVVVFMGTVATPVAIFTGSFAIVKAFNLDESTLPWVALAIGGTVGLYSIVGGLAAVVVTDVIQVSILLVGGSLVVVFGILAIPDLGAFWVEMKSSHLTMLRPADDAGFPWTGVFSGLALMSFIWASSNAGQLQRVLGAKNLAHAQGGMVLAAFLKLVMVFIIVFPGVIAASLFPGENPEGVYAIMVREMLPPVLAAVVLAALLSALMSSQDSGVCNISSIVALDLFPLFHPETSERLAVRVGRIAAGSVLVFGIIMAPHVGSLDSVYRFTLKIGAFINVPVGICFLLGRFSKRVNHQGALCGLFAGIFMGAGTLLLTSLTVLEPFVPAFMDTHFLHLGFSYGVFYAVLIYVVSLFFPPPNAEQLASVHGGASGASGETPDGFLRGRMKLWVGLFLAAWLSIYLVF